MKKSGISLIILIITVIIILILVTAVVIMFNYNNIINKAVKAVFRHDIITLEESAIVSKVSKLDKDIPNEDIISNYGIITEEEKILLAEKIPTLANTITVLNDGESIYDRNLYWLSVNNTYKGDNIEDVSFGKGPKEYIIDMETLKVYDTEGRFFDEKLWHTLDWGWKVDTGDGGNTGGGNTGGEEDKELPE